MIRVGVLGALGRMGAEVCRAVDADPETVLVAAVDAKAAGQRVHSRDGSITISDELDVISQAETDVVVDFTHPTAVMGNLRWCIRHAVDVVIGTTGLTQANLHEVEALIEEEGNETNVFVAPNFAIGAVLMMRFAAQACRYLPHVEIIELHHDQKADAPSGTALATARMMAETRGAPPSGSVVSTESVEGVRGGTFEGITIHSVRLPGLVAHQEVLLGGQGQTLIIRHDSIDRTSFMPGVLLAVKKIRAHPGVTVGLENILDA